MGDNTTVNADPSLGRDTTKTRRRACLHLPPQKQSPQRPVTVQECCAAQPQHGGHTRPGERLPAHLTPTVAFSLFWTSDKHCYVSFFSLPLFDSQTKGKHKLRKFCIKHSEGRRRGGAFPVHSQASVCRPARPRAWSAGLSAVPV